MNGNSERRNELGSILLWAGLLILFFLCGRHWIEPTSPDDFSPPRNLFFPFFNSLTNILLTGLAIDVVFIGAITLLLFPKSPRRHRIELTISTTLLGGLAGAIVLESVLLAHPTLLGANLALLPEQGRYLLGSASSGLPLLVDSKRYGFRYRAELDENYRVVRDDLLLTGDIPTVDEIAEPRFVSFRTDANGFRLPSPAPSIPPTIVALGDTVTMGPRLAEQRIWPQILARILDVPVLNLGVAGFCPTQEVRAFEEFGIPRRPRVAILMIFEGDDLDEEAQFAEFLEGSPTWRRPMLPEEPGPRLGYSLLWTWLRDRRDRETWFRTLWRRVPPREVPEIIDAPDRLNPFVLTIKESRVEVALHPHLLERLSWTQKAWKSHPGWTGLVEALDRFRSLCEHHGIHPLIVSIGTKPKGVLPMLDNRDGRARLERHFGEREAGFLDSLFANRGTLAMLIEERCETLGLPFLDYSPHLERKLSQGLLQFDTFSLTLASSGHSVLAKAISIELRQRGWVEAP